LHRVFWFCDLHQFHLVELVLTNHAAHITTITTRVGAEAWRMRNKFQWELVSIHNLVSYQISHRNFCGWYKVEVFYFCFARIYALRIFATHLARNLKEVFFKLR
jgi:hypothetical protein